MLSGAAQTTDAQVFARSQSPDRTAVDLIDAGAAENDTFLGRITENLFDKKKYQAVFLNLDAEAVGAFDNIGQGISFNMIAMIADMLHYLKGLQSILNRVTTFSVIPIRCGVSSHPQMHAPVQRKSNP